MTYCEMCTLPIQDEKQLFLLNRGGTPHYYHEHCIDGVVLYVHPDNSLHVEKIVVGTTQVFTGGTT